MEWAAGLLICASVVAGFAVLGFEAELHERLDALHSAGRLKRAPLRLARWLRLNPLSMIYILGLRRSDVPEERAAELVRRAQLLILVHALAAIAGLGVFLAFIVYPAISRAS